MLKLTPGCQSMPVLTPNIPGGLMTLQYNVYATIIPSCDTISLGKCTGNQHYCLRSLKQNILCQVLYKSLSGQTGL